LAGIPRRNIAQALAILLQDEAEGFWGSALDWARLGRYPHDRALSGRASDDALVYAALERVGIAHLAHRTMATLSGGERQRVRLAMVLAQEAEVVLLDEPLQHLDLRSQVAMLELFRALVRQQGKAVIMVLHDVYWASRYCDKTLLVFGSAGGGRIAQGETGTVLNRENMEALYGCSLQLVEAGGGRLFLPTGGAQ
jgi:iron complex transport system ATP-binding protein